jgi:PD-(D/E)XK nuclease superfamily
LLLPEAKKLVMTYSYTQIAQYLRCPRSYRYRYLDGWKEKDSRATLLFGRCFEQALGAYFRREDSAAALFAGWAKYQDAQLEYSHGDSWERMFRQGVQLLERLAQDDRTRSANPAATCRPSWCVRFQMETILSPTSMP